MHHKIHCIESTHFTTADINWGHRAERQSVILTCLSVCLPVCQSIFFIIEPADIPLHKIHISCSIWDRTRWGAGGGLWGVCWSYMLMWFLCCQTRAAIPTANLHIICNSNIFRQACKDFQTFNLDMEAFSSAPIHMIKWATFLSKNQTAIQSKSPSQCTQ